MAKIVDFVKVAQDVEIFWLSGNSTTDIPVKFNMPLDQITPFTVTRLATYNDTLNSVLAQISLYMSTCRLITSIVDDNKNKVKNISIGPYHTNVVLNQNNNFHYRRRLIPKKLIGNFTLNFPY